VKGVGNRLTLETRLAAPVALPGSFPFRLAAGWRLASFRPLEARDVAVEFGDLLGVLLARLFDPLVKELALVALPKGQLVAFGAVPFLS